MRFYFQLISISFVSIILSLTACGGSSPEPAADSDPVTYKLSGTVNNLNGSGLILQNGSTNMPVTGSGQVNFSFTGGLLDSESYNITISTQPSNSNQLCSVSNGSGTIAGADINNIVIDCVDLITIGGTVNGLEGSGLVLQDTGANDLNIDGTGNVAFTFTEPGLVGDLYNVTVANQPTAPNQTCVVTNNGSGTISGSINNITVNCVNNPDNTYSLSGTINNLQGQGLVITNRYTTESITVSGNGTTNFTFPTPLLSGQNYLISITTQPSSANQQCTVSGGASGTVATANINDIVINCTTLKYSLSGTISGLQGNNFQLQVNDGQIISLFNGASSFLFSPIDDGSLYNITVSNRPENLSQDCTITNGSGQLDGANVSNISINCVTSYYKVNGVINGLSGSGIVLQDQFSATPIAITDTGNNTASFEMNTTLIDGTRYWINVSSQPSFPYQQCTSNNNFSTLNGADANIVFNCVDTGTFSIGGRVSGLTGNGLILQNNAGDDLTINSNGSNLVDFTFASALPENQQYEITILQQPTNPSETCSVQQDDPFATYASENITNVFINCELDYSWLNPKPFGNSMTDVFWLNGKLYATAFGDKLLSSTNAVDWTNIKAANFYDMVWTGSQFVAVGAGVFTSPNATDWTQRDAGTTETLYGITWTGSQLVAVGAGGTIITSADGISWTSRNSNTTLPLSDVEWNGSTLAVVGTNIVMASSDSGASWLTVASGTGYGLLKVVWTGSRFVAVGSTGSIWPGSGYAGTSTNGVSWSFTAQNALPISGMSDLVWTGSQLVALAVNGNTGTSTDGLTWTKHTQASEAFNSITWTGTELIAVGDSGTVASSSNGISWNNKHTAFTDRAVRDFEYMGTQLVAVGGNFNYTTNQMQPLVMTSADNGTSWTVQSTPATAWLEKAAWSGNMMVSVGLSGLIMSSPNGVDWTLRSSGTSSDLYDVSWSNNLFITYGRSGTLLTSPDGITWTSRAISGVAGEIKGAAYNGTTMVATDANKCYLSTNSGASWQESLQNCGGDKMYVNGTNFLAFDYTGEVRESTDGSNWNMISEVPERGNTKDVAWSGSKLIRIDSRNRIYISDNASSWQQLNFSESALTAEWVGNQYIFGSYGGVIMLSE